MDSVPDGGTNSAFVPDEDGRATLEPTIILVRSRASPITQAPDAASTTAAAAAIQSEGSVIQAPDAASTTAAAAALQSEGSEIQPSVSLEIRVTAEGDNPTARWARSPIQPLADPDRLERVPEEGVEHPVAAAITTSPLKWYQDPDRSWWKGTTQCICPVITGIFVAVCLVICFFLGHILYDFVKAHAANMTWRGYVIGQMKVDRRLTDVLYRDDALGYERTDMMTVNLIWKPQGFGFHLLGGLETDTPLTVGQIVSGGAAADDGRLKEGDEIVEIDGRRVEGASHTEAVSLLEQAAHLKHVKLVIRRRQEDMPNGRTMSGGINERDLILHRGEGEGFGFIIMSSANRDGAYIGQIIAGSPAAHCPQLQVGDRVVAVNGAEIADMTHGEIVGLIKASGTSVRLTIADPAEPQSYAQHGGTATAAEAPAMSHNDYQSYSNNNGSLKTPNGHGANGGFNGSNGFVGSGATPTGHGGYDTMEGRSTFVNVELSRGTKDFGFSIRGGTEFDNMPLFVLRIAEDGPAASREGRLRVGDQFITINGRDTKGLTHEEAITLIKMYPTVRLTVRRVTIP